MKVIVNKFLTPRGFRGVTFFPFVIIANGDDALNKPFMNHEKIHWRQQLELLIVPFYVWYFLEFMVRLVHFKDRKKAYRTLSFEREAYENEKDLNYLQLRSFWSFLKYI